jgi:hypothetical protein
VGVLKSLQLSKADNGVGLRTQKRGFKQGNSLILGKLYVKSKNYTIKARNIQNKNTGRACINSPGIAAYSFALSVMGY